MGASEFSIGVKANTAKEAFAIATLEARHDFGHAGYTGTIAEKDGWILIPVPEGKDPVDFAEDLMETDDPRISGKWGPAGCVKVKDGEWLFFGWASS